MSNFLSKNDVDRYWNILMDQNIDLFIYSLTTEGIGNSWPFFYRNKILKLIVPNEIKIGTLEFKKNYCLNAIKTTKGKDNYLTIHSVMIRDLIKNLNSNSYCLLLDIDAFPLSEYALKLTFVLAMIKGINGNIQRTNCIKNDNHLFIGPSYICFYTKTIKNLKEFAWIANARSDVGEEITWQIPNLVDHNLFRPLNTVFKPVWALEGNKSVYGIGTTFGYNNYPINYHHFYSRNFVARLHFFFISMVFYWKTILSFEDSKKSKFRLKLFFSLKEIKFTIKYILGKIIE